MQERVKQIAAIGMVSLLAMFALLFFKDHRWRGRLVGDIEYQEKPQFSLKNWFNGHFQEESQAYLEENIGLRNYFVRSRNQVYFSLFNEASARDVVIGQHNYFYEVNYLKELIGENAIDEDELLEFSQRAKVVQDSLNAHGKELLIVIAPGKASYFPENIPDQWLQKPRLARNHDRVVRHLDQQHVSIFDASSWFVQMKATTNYPLYSETGIHWTHYGEALFLDSLSNYLNSKNIHVPAISFSNIHTSMVPKFPDDDIEQGMNLLFDVPNKTLAYPQLVYSTLERKNNALLIGDSYLWNMYVEKSYSNLFDQFYYYFYNENRFTYKYNKDMKVTPSLLKHDLNQSNCVILLSTEANLHRLYFNCINDLYTLVTNNSLKQ